MKASWMALLMPVIGLSAVLVAHAQTPAPAATAPIRIAVATFSHETCTFCPAPTGIAEWEYYGPLT